MFDYNTKYTLERCDHFTSLAEQMMKEGAPIGVVSWYKELERNGCLQHSALITRLSYRHLEDFWYFLIILLDLLFESFLSEILSLRQTGVYVDISYLLDA